jgi:hypothetical protein
MSNTRTLLAAILAFALSSAVAASAADKATAEAPQTQETILLDTIRANRKALVAVNLGLSPEQEKNFWPVYDRYQKEINANGDRVVAVVDEYTKSFHDLSDERATQLMDSYLSAEAERVQIRRSYLAEFVKILPGRTVARFYQLENKMDAVIRYDLAEAIPVIDEKSPAPAK